MTMRSFSVVTIPSFQAQKQRSHRLCRLQNENIRVYITDSTQPRRYLCCNTIKLSTMLKQYSLYLFLGIALTLSACSQEEEPVITPDPDPMTDPMPDPDPMEFDAAPDFAINTTGGKTLRLGDLQDKVSVIFFFGADCPPCRRAGPDIESKIFQEFKDNDKFAMIGADQWNMNAASVDDFVSTTGITFEVGVQGADMAKAFGTTFDRIVVLNDKSEIVYRSPSRASGRIDEAVDVVKDLLN